MTMLKCALIVCAVTSALSHDYQWWDQGRHFMLQQVPLIKEWHTFELVPSQVWHGQDGPRGQLNHQHEHYHHQDLTDLPLDQVIRDIHDFEHNSKLKHQGNQYCQGNNENPANQGYQYFPGQNQGNQYVPGQNQGNQYYPGQNQGYQYFPGQNQGNQYFPGQNQGNQYVPGQNQGYQYFPGQNQGNQYFPGQNQDYQYFPGMDQGNQYFPGDIQNSAINEEFNLPAAVKNEVNEEASNRQAAANQKALEPAPKCAASNVTNNPCTRQIVVPNFRKPGRRLAEIKCLEYIWDIKNKEENITKNVQCYNYRVDCLNATREGGYIGGRRTERGEFPHMGALGWRATAGGWIFKCGSSMISPNFMVTAAHCTRAKKDGKIANQTPEIVRIGAKNLVVVRYETYPKDLEIANIIPHPNYKSPRQYFDIALIELKEKFYFDADVRPACLWSRLDTNTVDSSITGSGWGVTEIGGRETTTELRAGDLDIINNDQCDQLLRPKCNRLWCGLEQHQMCAGKLSGEVDACQGDSGGPLQAKINLDPSIKGKMYYLLGVTSIGFGCGRANSPGIFTRISSFVDWIEPIVWPNEYAN